MHFLCLLILFPFISTVILITVVLLVIPSTIYRGVIIILSKLLKSNQLRCVMQETDPVFGNEDLYGPEALTCCYVFELDSPSISIQRVRHLVYQNAISSKDKKTGELLYPKLVSATKDWMGYRFWSHCPTFSVEEQVNYASDVGIASPNLNTKHGIQGFLKAVAKRQWTEGKPLWELLVVPSLKSSVTNGSQQMCSLLVWRQHHVISDGIAALKLLEAIGESRELWTPPIKASTQTKKEQLSIRRTVSNGMIGVLAMIENIVQLVSNRTKVPKQGSEDDWFISGDRKVSLSHIKTIKQSLGTAFSSVVFSSFSAAIKTLYTSQSEIPKWTNCVFPIQRSHSQGLRNNITTGSVQLPIKDKGDPVDRLIRVDANVRNFNPAVPKMHYCFARGLALVPSSIMLFVRRKYKEGLQVMMPPFLMNSVILPDSKLYFDKTLVRGMTYCINHAEISPEGAVLFTWTRGDYLWYKVVGAPGTFQNFEEADKFADCISKEISYLLEKC